ncbi:MAG: HAD family hydrolase [Polyangiaceae bacterium]
MGTQKAVLVDIDGTLLDSNDAHASAWVKALREAGHDVPFDKVRPLIGKGGDKLLAEVAGLSDDSREGTAIGDRRARIFRDEYLPTLKPFPRVRELLQRLHSDGYRLVVATSAEEKEMHALLERTGGAEFFEQAASSSDAENSKPDPDIVKAALRKADCGPEEALMLGDTPYDIEAAGAAAVGAIGLCSGGWSADALRGAIAIYENAADLLARYDTSPFSRRSASSVGRHS